MVATLLGIISKCDQGRSREKRGVLPYEPISLGEETHFSFSEVCKKLAPIFPWPKSCQMPLPTQILGKGKWDTMTGSDKPGFTKGNVDRIHLL